jgi:hypothetical protein
MRADEDARVGMLHPDIGRIRRGDVERSVHGSLHTTTVPAGYDSDQAGRNTSWSSSDPWSATLTIGVSGVAIS